ncbi:MAG: phosphate ABC transporter permease subunit PstC, partial [Candidatus Bipolaricaulota bacterium]
LSASIGFLLLFIVARAFNAYLLVAIGLGLGISWYLYEEDTVRYLLVAASTSAGIILFLITLFLLIRGLPAFRQNHPIRFLTGSRWDVYKGVYSLGPMIWGSMIVTFGATLFAAPLGVGSALFISKFIPGSLRRFLKPALELLAGIPSVVYGFLGFILINTFIMEHFEVSNMGQYLGPCLVLGLMALPTITSVAEDAIDAVPDDLEKGALALGVTRWHAIKEVTLPTALSGITAALILGIGRALGETMAVTMMIGHKISYPVPLFDVFEPGETLTSVIASQIGDASGQAVTALMAAGLLLFLIVLVLSTISRLIQARLENKFQRG